MDTYKTIHGYPEETKKIYMYIEDGGATLDTTHGDPTTHYFTLVDGNICLLIDWAMEDKNFDKGAIIEVSGDTMMYASAKKGSDGFIKFVKE